MTSDGQKIFCPHCRQESAIKMVKKYDGFMLVGEVKTCAFCGYEFSDQEPEVVEGKVPEGLQQKGPRKVCYRCQHYVVNPFVQKCVLHQKEVEALDSCPQFSPKPSPSPDGFARGPGPENEPTIF